MDVTNEWKRQLRAWASQHDAVRQLWLFGSRVKGGAKPDSDLDIAISLMPADWALGKYVALSDKWQIEIETLIGCKVSFGAIRPGSELDIEVRRTGVLLWARP